MDMKAKPRVDELRIDGDRLWASLMELAKIGATPKGGVCRLTLTDLDKQGRDLVTRWAREAGMTVTIDKIGNGFMRRAGPQQRLPPIITGSHIDTQPTGGKFDGNYGVLAGIEVVRTLNDHGIETEAPIEVAFWTNEEGSRFVPVMMGSGVFAKAFTLEHAYAAKDTEGKTVKDELERIGYVGSEEPGAHPIGSYFETHIEQGPVLEDNDKTIGVVTGVLGIRWYDCTVTGMEAHAGPTPMALRKDALQVAARLMQEVVACAHRHPPHGRGTVGMVQRASEQPQRHPRPRQVLDRPAQRRRRALRRDGCRHPRRRREAQRRVRAADPDRPGLVVSGTGLPRRLRRRGRARGEEARLLEHARGLGRRPRRGLHGPARTGGHDLHPLQGRHQPQRDRRRQARAHHRRLQRAACMPCWSARASPERGCGLTAVGGRQEAANWWSWGESNPRPKAFVRQIYTLSWLICF